MWMWKQHPMVEMVVWIVPDILSVKTRPVCGCFGLSECPKTVMTIGCVISILRIVSRDDEMMKCQWTLRDALIPLTITHYTHTFKRSPCSTHWRLSPFDLLIVLLWNWFIYRYIDAKASPQFGSSGPTSSNTARSIWCTKWYEYKSKATENVQIKGKA